MTGFQCLKDVRELQARCWGSTKRDSPTIITAPTIATAPTGATGPHHETRRPRPENPATASRRDSRTNQMEGQLLDGLALPPRAKAERIARAGQQDQDQNRRVDQVLVDDQLRGPHRGATAAL